MSETPPPVVQPDQPAVKKADWPLFLMSVVIVLCLGYAAFNWFSPGKSAVASKVVVFDSQRFFTAKARQDAEAKLQSPESVPSDTKAFVQALQAEVAQMGKDGLIVINSSQVVAWPDGADVTPVIAKKMGVKL